MQVTSIFYRVLARALELYCTRVPCYCTVYCHLTAPPIHRKQKVRPRGRGRRVRQCVKDTRYTSAQARSKAGLMDGSLQSPTPYQGCSTPSSSRGRTCSRGYYLPTCDKHVSLCTTPTSAAARSRAGSSTSGRPDGTPCSRCSSVNSSSSYTLEGSPSSSSVREKEALSVRSRLLRCSNEEIVLEGPVDVESAEPLWRRNHQVSHQLSMGSFKWRTAHLILFSDGMLCCTDRPRAAILEHYRQQAAQINRSERPTEVRASSFTRISLAGALCVKCSPGVKFDKRRNTFVVKTRSRDHYIGVDLASEADEWVDAISGAIALLDRTANHGLGVHASHRVEPPPALASSTPPFSSCSMHSRRLHPRQQRQPAPQPGAETCSEYSSVSTSSAPPAAHPAATKIVVPKPVRPRSIRGAQVPFWSADRTTAVVTVDLADLIDEEFNTKARVDPDLPLATHVITTRRSAESTMDEVTIAEDTRDMEHAPRACG